jgi:hypothetical protein
MLNWAEATFLVEIARAEAELAARAPRAETGRPAQRTGSFLSALFSRRPAAASPAAEDGAAGRRRLAA